MAQASGLWKTLNHEKRVSASIWQYLLKKLLQYYLKYITKLVLFIYRPTIITIAGSTNKTFVKEEIKKVLKKQGLIIRSNPKSFNTEIGLPLAILNLSSGYNSYRLWLPIIFQAAKAIFNKNFPKILVLELGISEPADMKYLLSIIHPKIAVITDITQRYLESFSDMDELVSEYEYLAKKIDKSGLIILNYDNLRVRKLATSTKVKIKFFGLQKARENIADFWMRVLLFD